MRSFLRRAYRTGIERLARLYVRRELPGWGLIYRGLVGFSQNDGMWQDSERRTVTDKIHGFELQLDIGTWSERITYFLGRYYDLPTQLLLIRVLRPGDHVYDVGANVGHLSLLMAKRVGESGRVDAFEPNPATLARLRAAVAQNHILNIFLHDYGLSSEDDVLELFIPKASSGETTFTPTPYSAAEVDAIKVSVKLGDSVVRDVGLPVLVKIDVEGFECRVIDGLANTLRKHRPLVITEVMPDHLARAGEGSESLFDRMRGFGYEPLRLSLERRGLGRKLELSSVSPEQIEYADVIWFDPTNQDHLARLRPS